MMEIPDKIYLQIEGDLDFEFGGSIHDCTWCSDQINDSDVEYLNQTR